jgi:hypothetical protein
MKNKISLNEIKRLVRQDLNIKNTQKNFLKQSNVTPKTSKIPKKIFKTD